MTLAPPGEPVGRLLLSYVIDPFFAASEGRIAYAHTQDWESWAMAHTWRELGFTVDVIHWTNSRYLPRRPLDVLIDARHNLERLAPAVGPSCLKLFHAETAHWRVNDEAQRRRLGELEQRRGIRLSRLRLVSENRGIENADAAIVLGNEWTLASYRPFGKPLYRVPISNPLLYPSPEERDFEALRGRFLWFGGIGFVHKGLDLVLDAFAGQAGLWLEVAAPLDREPDFARDSRLRFRRGSLADAETEKHPRHEARGCVDVLDPQPPGRPLHTAGRPAVHRHHDRRARRRREGHPARGARVREARRARGRDAHSYAAKSRPHGVPAISAMRRLPWTGHQ